MIIIETCPKCGHDLRDTIICTNPPIPRKECNVCGWSWEGKQEQVIRIPFGGNSNEIEDTSYLDYTILNGDGTPIAWNFNGGEIENSFSNETCKSCSNNPKNGGSGICFCTLGGTQVYC